MTSITHPNALPEGYRVQEYEFLSVLGVGGFGITYLARDTLLDRTVAIKEYLPRDFAVRTENHSVQPRSSTESESYTWGLERFLDEARILARLNHPSVIRIHKYFEAHGSGYIVMEYIESETLDERLKRQNTLNESQLMNILNPLVQGLEQVHAAGYLHRDITPKNILLRKDGSPVLIDFGSARQELGVRSRSVTSVVTPGYAPLEQYSTRSKQQGAWTDVYGLSAVAYRCITGTVPKDATERAQGEALTPASQVAKGQYTEGLLTAVDRGLAVKAEERPQDLKAWYSLREQKRPQKTTTTEKKEQEIGGDGAKDKAKKKKLGAQPDVKGRWARRSIKKYLWATVLGVIVVLITVPLAPVLYDEIAVIWLKYQAEQGHAGAQYKLGWQSQDNAEKVKWWRRAAEQGHAGARRQLGGRYFFLGYRFYSGEKSPQDYAEAAKWYRLAAEQGYPPAQFCLGAMYLQGLGVPHDNVIAIKWYQLAAEQGYTYAQYVFGRMYENGKSMPQDYIQAHKWYNLVASSSRSFDEYYKADGAVVDCRRDVRYEIKNGRPLMTLVMTREEVATALSRKARKFRAVVEARMTREEVATAQRLAREWQPKTWDQLKAD